MSADNDRYPGLRDFVAARAPALSRTAYLLTGDHQLAEDLVQSALARVLGHWRRIRHDNPEAYLRRTMVHLQISAQRRKRITEFLTAAPPERTTPDLSQAATLRISLDQALASLTVRQRAVLVFRFYDDLSEAQIAEAMSCTVGTVKRHGHDALARLRRIAPHLTDAVRPAKEDPS